MATPSPCVGNRYGLRQPAVKLELRFRCPAVVDFKAVDRWLASTFDAEVEPLPLRGHGLATGMNATSMAWRILWVASQIRQAARLPVFETGRILKLGASPKDPGETHVLVAVPEIDRFPVQSLGLAFSVATNVVTRAVGRQRDGLTKEELYQQIDAQAVQPLVELSRSGISTFPILHAAFQRGIPFRHLGEGAYQLGWGSRNKVIQRSMVGADSAIGARWSARKDLTADLLRAAGLPAARHIRVSDEHQALGAAEVLGWPVVVKPADRDRSEGVTVHIDSPEKLRGGFKAALAHSRMILIEAEVPGICFRLLIANGRFLYAISRNPVSIVGDGKQSVAELILARVADVCKRPLWYRAKVIGLDEFALSALDAQGLGTESVPAIGQRVNLRTIESSEWGGDIEDVTHLVHPDNKDIAVRAARLFGLKNAGVDLITMDISVPWHVNGAVINEVNFSPYFGGNPVARAKLPEFFEGYIEEDGRVPVEVFVGGAHALRSAEVRQRELFEMGVPSHLTSHVLTLDGKGAPLAIASNSSYERVLALLMNQDVQAIIIVVQTDEWLVTGLPIDRINKIHLCDGVLVASKHGPVSGENQRGRLINLLKAYTT